MQIAYAVVLIVILSIDGFDENRHTKRYTISNYFVLISWLQKKECLINESIWIIICLVHT